MKLRVFVAALLGFSVPIPAHAYVRTTTSSGTPIAWTTGCLQFQVDSMANPRMSSDRLKAALDAAIAAWNQSDASCSKMQVARGGDVSGSDVAFDGRSVVMWRLPGFCDAGAHADDEACLAPNATATTTVFFHDKPGAPDDGDVVEADMELNAVHFAFDDQGAPDKIDLETVLAHETGHALGLDHTCYTNRGDVPLLDDQGQPQPFCFPVSALSPAVTSATMFNFTAPGDTSKRGPTHDETSAVCAIYAGKSATCSGDESKGGGCSVAVGDDRSTQWGLALAAGAIFLFAAARMRRAR